MPAPERDTDPVHDVHPLAQRGAQPRRPGPWTDRGVEVLDDATTHFDLPAYGLQATNPAARWPLPGPRRRTIEELRAEIDDEIGRQVDGTRAGEDDGTLTDDGELADEVVPR